MNTPSNFWDWFILNHTVHSYNTTSNTIVDMNNNFDIESISETNILHTRCSELANYGAKMLRVAGPLLWNSLPKHIRNSKLIFNLKSNLKKFFADEINSHLLAITL